MKGFCECVKSVNLLKSRFDAGEKSCVCCGVFMSYAFAFALAAALPAALDFALFAEALGADADEAKYAEQGEEQEHD